MKFHVILQWLINKAVVQVLPRDTFVRSAFLGYLQIKYFCILANLLKLNSNPEK